MDNSIAQLFAGNGPYALAPQQPDQTQALARMLAAASSEGGLAPFGLRHDGSAPKGKGFFGPMLHKQGGVSTEISAGDESGEFPLMVPTLSRDELELLLSGQDPTDAIYGKARAFADQRRAAGKNPFAQPGEFTYPAPVR